MAVHPGFTESSVHDFWTLSQVLTLGLHIYMPQGPGEGSVWI